MRAPVLAFIGGGNMARSLIGGLIADRYDPQRIHVADPDPGQLQLLSDRFPVHTGNDNMAAATRAEVLILAVKPQLLRTVVQDLAQVVQSHRPLVVSIAAGIRVPDLQRWVGESVPVVRAMPNTPALVRSGATALYASSETTPQQRNEAEAILRAVGLTVWLESESQMDAVTALSGSGPAYFFLLMEVLESAGAKLGLSPATARLLVLETALGSARMALESSETIAVLRERVTSPGERPNALCKRWSVEDSARWWMPPCSLRARDRRSLPSCWEPTDGYPLCW